ncbi:hypothetical protein GH714_038324 [Hevea brasiliensis]|uniref:Cationic amino acid transporter C-terminal domain-containing protein n=1 Tax=Hevea brasiliensis TaxID=3981 RepID=A0A6A6MN30_HEVBR|nr:hypothetical protein GH714_038324 [Hevea brasiliensis]
METQKHTPFSNMATIQSSTTNTSFSKYLQSLSQTPHRLKRRMLATWTPDQELNQVRLRSGADMKRKLKWHDLIALGVGGMLGVGVFVTTGSVAHEDSGPAVFISYIIAGISALLSSLCYTEFSVQIPVAGGAFSYLRVTFGEFVGYFAGANILLEYVLSNAAVARSFTDYLCHALGENDSDSWRVEVDGLVKGYDKLDFTAVVLILLLTLCLCHRQLFLSLYLSLASEGLLLLVSMVLFMEQLKFTSVISATIPFQHGRRDPKPFKKPSCGHCGFCSHSLCAILPHGLVFVLGGALQYDTQRCILFHYFPKDWVELGSNVVGAGASLGIVASLLVAMLGQARYLCVFGRARLVPSWLAKVHPSTGTPLNATLFLGLCTASIALFTDLSIVLEMISISTLLVFYLVANALIYRRYVIVNQNPPSHTLLYLFLLSCSAISFSISWKLKEQRWGLSLFGVVMIAITAFFQNKISSISQPNEKWSVPFMPWPAAISIFLNVFLMTTLKLLSFQRFALWACLITTFYVLYGVHSTYEAEEIEVGADEIQHPPVQQQSKLEIQVL